MTVQDLLRITINAEAFLSGRHHSETECSLSTGETDEPPVFVLIWLFISLDIDIARALVPSTGVAFCGLRDASVL